MPINTPDNPKVYTHIYQNFAGVDFSNDMSNIWHRRTPTGTNMIPDESGRPFKRTGWKKEVTAETIAALYAADNEAIEPSEITIRKCYYFTLNGEDHVVVFTNYGAFMYHGGTLTSFAASYDKDIIESWERGFFFEGNGKAAFYVYGNFRIWEYTYDDDNGFTWSEADPYIPCVNIGVDARHESGTSFEEVNLFSDYIAETFENNAYRGITSATTDITGGSVEVDTLMFLAKLSNDGTHTFTYTTAEYSWLYGGDQVVIADYGISLTGTPVDGSTITVVVGGERRINLGKIVPSIDGMEVWVSDEQTNPVGQYNKQLTLQATATVTTKYYCTLVTPLAGNSYLVFYEDWNPLVDGEDAIKVIYPRNSVSTAEHTLDATITVTAEVGE